jgi:hypothetical protein
MPYFHAGGIVVYGLNLVTFYSDPISFDFDFIHQSRLGTAIIILTGLIVSG